jgi:aldehyde:ferredoxin oxidoreductase
MAPPGYLGKLLRVDLGSAEIWTEELLENELRLWVGGVALGAKYLLEEVGPQVSWDHPENRLILTSGPVAGSGFGGAATFNVVSKGPMTNMAGSSQANGFMGAYMKFCGFDGVIIQGRSRRPVYLEIKEGRAFLKDASGLWGLPVDQTEEEIRKELGAKRLQVSVFAIGPAGENLVRYAAIVGDGGHVAAHNGLGAVMGAKKLKALVAHNAPRGFSVADPAGLKQADLECFSFMKEFGPFYKWGTGGGFSTIYGQGALPVRNYTTNIFQEHERMNGQYLRSHFQVRPRPCFRCRMAHVKEVTVTEGPYKGFTAEEPEYEQIAAWGPQIGNTDLGGAVLLAHEVDRLGMDCNEASWCVGWAMECYEKGRLDPSQTEGLELNWGNVEAVKELLARISRRQGFLGELLAEGVMRAAKRLGGEPQEWAVHTMQGASPRGHDHRGRWTELFDTCVSNTSTIESSFGGIHAGFVGMKELDDPFEHLEVARSCARFNGIRQFDDCVGICRLASINPRITLRAFNAVTGWGFTLEDAFRVGLRAVNALRLFNLRHGLRMEELRPSARYGSVPKDGPAAGKNIMARWGEMVRLYHEEMGWDPSTGWPLPSTLEALGIRQWWEELSGTGKK